MAKDDMDLFLVKRALKNNAKGRDALSIILSNASVYFYCLNEMERKGDYSKTFSCITVEDRFGDAFPKDFKFEFISENQKRQLMAINGWETDEDINKRTREEGVLTFEYKECA